MELHPILDQGVCPNPGLWYVLAGLGECPSMRVGHTATYMAGQEGQGGKLLCLGGANPDGPFSDTYVLDLERLTWDRWDMVGMKPRYEHATFTPACHPDKVYVFGGADQGGNHNDIQVLDVSLKTWSSLRPAGTPPSPRTLHVSACLENKFYVYSGGQCASDPVGDRQVYCYDACENEWHVLNVRGEAPKPRLGHVLLGVEGKLLLHGGMAGTTFYDDLFVLDPAVPSWKCIKQKRLRPAPRAAHAAVAKGSNVYIFGGMNREGALDDFYRLDTKSMQWSRLCLAGPPPAPRLDFAMCIVTLLVGGEEPDAGLNGCRGQAKDVLENQMRLGSAGSGHSAGSAGSHRSLTEGKGGSEGDSDTALHLHQDVKTRGSEVNESADPEAAIGAANFKTVDMCVVLGGMDTEGEIFDDLLAIMIH